MCGFAFARRVFSFIERCPEMVTLKGALLNTRLPLQAFDLSMQSEKRRLRQSAEDSGRNWEAGSRLALGLLVTRT